MRSSLLCSSAVKQCFSPLSQEEDVPSKLNKQHRVSELHRSHPCFHSGLHKSSVNKVLLSREQNKRDELSRHSVLDKRETGRCSRDSREEPKEVACYMTFQAQLTDCSCIHCPANPATL